MKTRAEPSQIGRILESGKYHVNQARIGLESRSSPAGAYWEYMVAYQIVVEALPGHRDYYDKIDRNRGQLHRDFNQLAKVHVLKE